MFVSRANPPRVHLPTHPRKAPSGSAWVSRSLGWSKSYCRSGSTHRFHSRAHDEAVFLYAFDLLELNSEDYRSILLTDAKQN